MVMILVNTYHNIHLQNYLRSVIQFMYCVNHLPGLERVVGGLVLLLMIISLIADFMKNTVVTAIFLTILSIFNLSGQDNKKVMDWANLTRYKEANISLLKEKPSSSTIVLMGNSITEGWVRERPDFFKANTNLVGRGISGQTTPQMLLRFKQDVVHLKPKLVVLLCGINEIEL